MLALRPLQSIAWRCRQAPIFNGFGALTRVITVHLALLFMLAGCQTNLVEGLFPTPTPVMIGELSATISLDPATGYAGSFVQVIGTGWEPGQVVSLQLESPTAQSEELTTGQVDAGGRFVAGFLYPLDERWIQPGDYAVSASTARQQSRARFEVNFPTTPSATPTITPFVTSTPLPTFTPSGTPTPTSVPTDTPLPATVTAIGLPAPDEPAATPTPPSELSGREPVQTFSSAPVWLGSYWDNGELFGQPAFLREDGDIDFDWEMTGPNPIIAPLSGETFSVQWTRTVTLTPGLYRFTMDVHGSARLFIDERLVINEWVPGDLRTATTEQTLSGGVHRLRLDYANRSGPARIRLAWLLQEEIDGWLGSYYDNPAFQGAPALTRMDRVLDFDWGKDGPGESLPAENFSVRWERMAAFAGGRYRFTLVADDGARVWIDGNLVIDGWPRQPGHLSTAELYLTKRVYTLRIEYVQRVEQASITFDWTQVAPGVGESTSGE